MAAAWIDRHETRMDQCTDRAQLERHVADLERRLAEVEEWVQELADDMLTRTTKGVA